MLCVVHWTETHEYSTVVELSSETQEGRIEEFMRLTKDGALDDERLENIEHQQVLSIEPAA